MKTLPNIPKHPLNDQFRRLGVTRPQLSAHLSRPVPTVAAWLNGYTPMPSEAESRLIDLLHSLEAHGGHHETEG